MAKSQCLCLMASAAVLYGERNRTSVRSLFLYAFLGTLFVDFLIPAYAFLELLRTQLAFIATFRNDSVRFLNPNQCTSKMFFILQMFTCPTSRFRDHLPMPSKEQGYIHFPPNTLLRSSGIQHMFTCPTLSFRRHLPMCSKQQGITRTSMLRL